MHLTIHLKAACKPTAWLVLCSLMASCASDNSSERLSEPRHSTAKFGLLIMAHGGSEQWNAGVLDSITALRQQYPVAVAFGMADAGSIERSVRKLEASRVTHVAVVRLFISGESWYDRTRQILGVTTGAPEKSKIAQGAGSPAAMAMHQGMPMGFWKIDTDLIFSVSQEGLANAEEMNAVVQLRVDSLSKNPSQEAVVILAHGPADDGENERWLEQIAQRASSVNSQMNFHDIKVFTLREDWQEKRAKAEQQIRNYIVDAKTKGLDVIVVPYRVHGFGPYAKVLAGLDYRADYQGLIPHENITLWVENQANAIRTRLTTGR